MTRILIGYDGSAEADAALDDLPRAGLPRDAEARVLTVGDYVTPPTPPGYPVAAFVPDGRPAEDPSTALVRVTWASKGARAMARRAAWRIRDSFPDWWVRAEEFGGAPPRALMRAADEWEADLLVVGSPHRSRLGRLLLGSVSRTVVADADCSVRVGRPRTERSADAPPRILVGVDGSPEAEGAVRAVGGRVWPSGTEVRVVAVDDSVSPRRFRQLLPAAAAMIAGGNREAAARAREMVEWATGALGQIGLDASSAFASGDARRVLVEEARAWGADSVFVGAHSFGGALARFRAGRVSTGVAMDAPCSVEVVRAL